MFFYEGMSCPVCGKTFLETDDIVACPECGAPHHRACWQKENRCAYAEDHGTPRQWTRAQSFTGGEEKTNRCPNCGAQNPAHAEFCSHCGRELHTDTWRSAPNQPPPNGAYVPPMNNGPYPPPPNGTYTPPNGNPYNPYGPGPGPYSEYAPFRSPFADPCGGVPSNEIIDGETAEDLAAIVGPNAPYYVPRFSKMHREGSRASWNWPAFLIPSYWLMYRKQYLIGILMLLFEMTQTVMMNLVFAEALNQESYAAMFNVMNTILSGPNGTLIVALVMMFGITELLLRVVFGVFGNRLYMRHCVSRVRKARSADPVGYRTRLPMTGGTSIALSFLSYMCAQIVPMMILFAFL